MVIITSTRIQKRVLVIFCKHMVRKQTIKPLVTL
nr:MAG TPA: hypothetical protein [Caudoviricetes sp.]